jgi:hypothetical protein
MVVIHTYTYCMVSKFTCYFLESHLVLLYKCLYISTVCFQVLVALFECPFLF